MIKHICFVTGNYPTLSDPIYVFVRELVCKIADMGIKCTVISPQSLFGKISNGVHSRPLHWIDTTINGNTINIYQPLFLSISKLNKWKFGYNERVRSQIIKKTFDRIFKINSGENQIDILYAHFWSEGMTIAEIAQKYQIKAFVASGESKIFLKDIFVKKYKINYKKSITGCFAVSQKNRMETINNGLLDDSNIEVVPNAISPEEFYVEDKIEVRKKLGIPINAFIIVFCGYFIVRKGINRLSEALEQIDNVHSIFIGSGPISPTLKNNLFTGKLPHKQLVHYLNAADVFVLPTLAEGCCNAIIEALGCGLPVISSNRSFNDDILGDSYSIRINPESVTEIKNAITKLRDNPTLLRQMSVEAQNASKKFHLSERARIIVDYMSKK